jgi:hypothetical protein
MHRIVLVIGIVCLLAGALFATGAVSLPNEQTLVSVGEASLSVETREQAPPALGFGLLALGALLAAGSLLLRRR